MTRTRLPHIALALFLTALILAAGLPAGAAYTKLYTCKNTTGITQSHLRVINNALEVILGSTATPSELSPPVVGTCVWNGVYSTKLRFGAPVVPTVANGGYGTIGWRTADNSCRLSDLRWVSPAGDPVRVTDALQLQGIPGGGEVWYDSANQQYVWLLINDNVDPDDPNAKLAIDLSDVTFEVMDAEPAIDWVTPMSTSALMRPMQIGALPHPDVVALRVAAVLSTCIEPLQAEVTDEQAAGHLSLEDANELQESLGQAQTCLEQSVPAYDPIDPSAAQDLWADARGWMEQFSTDVEAIPGGTPQGPDDYSWSTLALLDGLSPNSCGGVNDARQLAVQLLIESESEFHAFLWDPAAGLIDLRALAGDANYSNPLAIDEAGRVIGWVRNGEVWRRDCIWEPNGQGGYSFAEIPHPGWEDVTVSDVNALGQIVGSGVPVGDTQRHGLLWHSSTEILDLGPGFNASYLNNHGDTTGYAGGHPCIRYASGEMFDLYPGTPWTTSYFLRLDINNSRVVVGQGLKNGQWRACYWDENRIFSEIQPPGWEGSAGESVNDSGLAVGRVWSGSEYTSPVHAVLWDLNGGEAIDIHPDPEQWTQSVAEAISDSGIVAGWCSNPLTASDCLFTATPTMQSGAFKQQWLSTAASAVAMIDDLPGPGEAAAAELPPPDDPPLPPPPADIGGVPYSYVNWAEMQQEETPVLPERSYTAFAIPDVSGTQDSVLVVRTRIEDPDEPGTYLLECLEVYTPGDEGVRGPDSQAPVIQ